MENGSSDTMRFVSVDRIRSKVRAEIKKYCDEIVAPALGEVLGELARDLEVEFAAKLEAITKEFSFKGQWSEGTLYRRGNFVSQGGAIFHCNCDTTAKPGADCAAWTLAAARGRDGRDAPDRRTVASHRSAHDHA